MTTIAWAAVGLWAIVMLQSVFRQPVGLMPGAIAVALSVFAAIRPYNALSVFAAIGPLATVVFIAAATEATTLRYHEALALGFIAGWSIQRAVRPRPLATSPALCWAIGVLIALVAASTIVAGSIAAAENVSTTAGELFTLLFGPHYLVTTGPLASATLLAEGLVLIMIASETCAGDGSRRETLLRMMLLGASAAAVVNLLRLVMVSVEHEDALSVFASYFFTRRVNVHYSDLNAGGSYFAMMLVIALGFALRARMVAIPASALIAAGLWLTGSRTAMAAAFATLLVSGLLALRTRPGTTRIRIAAALAAFVLVGVGVWTVYPEKRNAPGGWSLSTRAELAQAGLKMTATEPVFGVGIGRFYILSNQYVGPMLAAQGKVRENAHNYFVQVLAELGVSGLLLFLSVLGLALRAAWRANDPTGIARAICAGLMAFLLTCLGGHPLLVPGAAYPFWLALGLAAVNLHAAPAINRRVRIVGIVLMAVIAASVPFRMAAAGRLANLEHVSSGFSRWQTQPDGSRYRWAGGRSMFYVSSAAHTVRIPLEHGGGTGQPIEVVVFLDGREINRVLLPVDEEWRTVRVTPMKRSEPGFARIDLEAREAGRPEPLPIEPTDTSGAIRVGRPSIDF